MKLTKDKENSDPPDVNKLKLKSDAPTAIK